MQKRYKLLIFTRIILLIILLMGYLSICETKAYADSKPKIIIGNEIDYAPYSYLDSKGNPTGFNIELAKAVGAAMGYDVEIRIGEWSKTPSVYRICADALQ